MEANDLSDGSTSDDSDIAILFNKVDADVKAGMAELSSDEDVAGIQLYYTGLDDDVNFRRAARQRKRRVAANFNSDDDDDEEEVSFVPKSQSKKTPGRHHQVVSLLQDTNAVDSSDEESPQSTTGCARLNGVLNSETSRRLMELRCTKSMNAATMNQQMFLAEDEEDAFQSSRHRWITVKIEGTKESITFTMEENNSVKDVISKCVEQFKMDLDTPIGLYYENRLLNNSDLLFDVPIQCTLIARVYKKLHVKEAPKGTMMRLTLRGPNGDKDIRIGSLQPLKVALDQYGSGKGLKFDGDVLQLDRQPGAYELEDEDLIDVIA